MTTEQKKYRKARVLVTYDCNRSCDGCCNNHRNVMKSIVNTDTLELLKGYDEIMITGGEPTLLGPEIVHLVYHIRAVLDFKGFLYYYSALYDWRLYSVIMKYIDGIHYTLHYECDDHDILLLRQLSRMLANTYASHGGNTNRLNIDKRLYDRYDLSNIDMTRWSIVRKMEWKPECPLPENETLFYYDLLNSKEIDKGLYPGNS